MAVSFIGTESLQRCLRKHLSQHAHEIPLGECARTIAQHRHRAGGLGVSEESLDLLEQRDRARARTAPARVWGARGGERIAGPARAPGSLARETRRGIEEIRHFRMTAAL